MTENILWILRWTARVAGILMAAAFVFLVLGELATVRSSLPPNRSDWFGMLLLGIACFALLFAFKWEWQGAVLSLAALGLFARLIAQRTDIVLWVASVPAFLFLADWLLRKGRAVLETDRHHPRTA
jgi:hypothetical protein